jgi:hypothetical protein
MKRLCVFVFSVVAVCTLLAPAGASTGNPGSGYWMLGADGNVYAFGTSPYCGKLDVFLPNSFGADIAATPDGRGYWMVDGENYVDFEHCGLNVPYNPNDRAFYDYEWNNFFADTLRPGESPISISALPDGKGYWVFTDKGRALPFGTAQWYGDMGNVALSGPILDSVATPSGHGYWMVGSDGGIFSFGDAAFYGSMGGQRLNKPVTSMAPDPDGSGYWLVASDGGIFAFSAPFYGSMGATRLNKPVVGIVASPTGGGYLMVGADGGIFTFGDVPFHGSLGGNPPYWPITSVAVMP